MGYDEKAFAAAVINLAVKGAITIHEDDPGEFFLKRTGAPVMTFSRGEQKIIENLFGSSDMIKLTNENHKDIRGAILGWRTDLNTTFENLYFSAPPVISRRGLIITFNVGGYSDECRQITVAKRSWGYGFPGWPAVFFYGGSGCRSGKLPLP
jgi:hypothetical protein